MDKAHESNFILRGSVSRMHPNTSSSDIAAKSLSSSSHRDTVTTTLSMYSQTAAAHNVGSSSGSGSAPTRSAGVEAATEVAAIAYYIEPGGKMTPVNICHSLSALSSSSTLSSGKPRQEHQGAAMLYPGFLITSEERGEGSSSSASGGPPPQLHQGNQSCSTLGEYEERAPINYREAGFQGSSLRPEQGTVHRMSAMYDWTDPDSQPARELLSQYSYWSGSGQSDVTRPGSAVAESRPGDRLEVGVDEAVGRRSWS